MITNLSGWNVHVVYTGKKKKKEIKSQAFL